MFFRGFSWLAIAKKITATLILLCLFAEFSSAQVFSEINLQMKLVPTSLVVSPPAATVAEGSANIQYTAVAKYDYPGLTTAIPDKDVTNDALTLWESDNNNVALVNTVGLVTPVSDLDTGNAPAAIKATYGGITGQARINVTGNVTAPPTGGNGGGGGSGGFGQGPTQGGEPFTPGQENPPGENPPVNNPPTENPPGENPPTEEGGTEQPGGETTTPGQETGTQPGENPPTGGQTVTNPAGEVPVDNFGVTLPRTSVLPLESPVTRPDQITEEELFPPIESLQEETGGVSRAFVVAKIADDLNVLNLRKSTLDKCYADLANCTNIFRMFSSYQGITLDENSLKLFPDVSELKQADQINKMALLGIVQGYYALPDSPFLPDRPITRVETLKVLSTVLSNFEKSKADYVEPAFDYNALFYQDVYAASLLYELQRAEVAMSTPLYQGKVPGWGVIKLASALTDEAYALVKSQRTVFSDVRPDLYDAHWYYPIVYNKLCPLGLIACKQDGLAVPDKSPSETEVNGLISKFDKYFKDNDLDKSVIADDDDDGITNLDENVIYLTNPKSKDTDVDDLNDGDELLVYKTDPNKTDTDFDGLTDGNEVLKYKTDPNLYDTDGDGFSDSVEIAQDSDPLDKMSIPDDKNGNTVADKWEAQYDIVVANGSQDTDGDGLPDLMEYYYGTNPINIDSDRDGFTDGEEILEVQSDPNNELDPGDARNLPVAITNLQYGQVIAESNPLIKGVGPASVGEDTVEIQLLLRNEFGSELMLGKTTTDAKGRFIFIPDLSIKDGTYFLLARSIRKGEVKLSKPIKVIIDSSLQVASAKPEKLEDSPITDEVIVKKLVLKVDSRDGQPVLYGSLSEFGSRVNVTWQSLIVSSALIADTTDGSFTIKAPKLEAGRHTVYVQTVRKRDNAIGKTLKITFDLGLRGSAEALGVKSTNGPLATQFLTDIGQFVRHQSWPFWAGTVLVILLIIGGIYYWKLDEDDRSAAAKRKERIKKK